MSDILQFVARLAIVTFIVSSMLAMGLSLTPRAIIGPLKNVRLVVFSLLVNFVVAPALAYLLTIIIPLQPPHAIGLLLLSGAAGAPFLPKLAEAARGDLAFSVALMVLLMAGTMLFMPFGLPLLIPGMHTSPWEIAQPLLLLMVLPLVGGMFLQSRAAGFSAKCRAVVGVVSNVSLLLLLVLLIGLNFRALLGVVGSGAIAASLLFVALLLVAGYLAGGSKSQMKSVLGLGSAARNIGAALPIASAQGNPRIVIMLLVVTLVGVFVSLAAAHWLRRGIACGSAHNSPSDGE